MSAAPGWEGILAPDERIVWQRQPRRGLTFTGSPMKLLMGLFFVGFSVMWMVKAAEMTQGRGFPFVLMPLFGLIFLVQGIGMAGGKVLWDAYARSRTWYTLTDRRAFVARRLFGRKSLKSWDIARFDRLEVEYGPPGNVWFASRQGKNGKLVKTGFTDLDDAGEVHRLIRDLRKETA